MENKLLEKKIFLSVTLSVTSLTRADLVSHSDRRSGKPAQISMQENLTQINRLLFFLICIVGGGVRTGSTRHVGHLLAYCTCPG
jgi:hypothetical protein